MIIKNYKSYIEEVENQIGENNYPFSQNIIVITKKQFEEIKKISSLVMNIFKDKDFYKTKYTEDWMFPQTELTPNDFIGSIDVHINNDSIKIIEINCAPIGKINFVEMMESTALKNINDTSLYGPSEKLFEKLIYSIHQDRYKNIAICDIDVQNQTNIIEFKYLKKNLEKLGLKAEIEDVTDLYLNNNLIVGKKGSYDRIYNRLVPSQWRENKKDLKGLSNIFINNSSSFYNNPNAWILSNKNILNDLLLADNQLSPYILKSSKLSDFNSLEEIKNTFGSPSKIVIKPCDSFASQSVYYKPSNKIIIELINNNLDYTIQELFPPGKIEYIDEETQQHQLKYDIRIIFVNSEIAGLSSRIYEGAITNFRSENSGFAPVLVKKS